MRYFALATDYDGTLAKDGVVDRRTMEAVEELKKSGRRLLLVTGRELDDLERTFDHIDAFDRVVAENGAVVFDPAKKKVTLLAEAPPDDFCAKLREKGVAPLSCGRVIVATREPHQDTVLRTINEMGLELQVIFNKGAVMVLPSGVNKATGLKCAVEEMGLSHHNVAGIGDAENDHAFLSSCEFSAAVANALPALKERADWVTSGARGEGVQELVRAMLADDLAGMQERLAHHDILLGRTDAGEVRVPACGSVILLAGTSGGGKSTLTTGFMERIAASDYQFCTIDPEGDYQKFAQAIILGDAKRVAQLSEVLGLLERPGGNVIVNLLGIGFEHRPAFFADLLSRISALRARTGRPHWVVVDEAHHVMPAESNEAGVIADMQGLYMITLEPERLAPAAVSGVTHLIAVGAQPAATLESFCRLSGRKCPTVDEKSLPKGEALLWKCAGEEPPLRFRVEPAESAPVRHSRKYATAELTPDRSFYFRGPEGRLNLRAQNLVTFVQLMEGVDDETWLFHLRKGEYSAWFRENIKSEDLAEAARMVEQANRSSAAESRKAMREVIEQRYTLA